MSTNNDLPKLGDQQQLEFDFSKINRKWLNVPYAYVSSSQKLDIFLPNDTRCEHPVILIIHGGGFKFGDKQGIELKIALEPALQRGYAVVSINYRLSGEATFPAAPQDINAAIRFLRYFSKKYRLDPCHFFVWGSSSGGNLASLAGTTGNSTCFVNSKLNPIRQPWNVNAVVDFYGPINFLTMDSQFVINGIDGQNHNTPDSFESQYLGAPICCVPNLVKLSNPETYLSSAAPPFLILHGTKDANIPYQQSVLFSQAISCYLPDCQINLRLIDGAKHGGPQFETTEVIDLVFDFLDCNL